MPDTHFGALRRHRDFMRLWSARLFGTTGNQMLMVAIGWQMYDLTGSAWDLGLVGLYQFVPALLFTLVAGHVADRVHRGRIIAACMVAQVLTVCLLVAATEGFGAAQSWASRGLLLGVSVVLGLARAFQMPAQQALTPMLLPAHLLPRGLAFSSAGMQTAIIGGPALGGAVALLPMFAKDILVVGPVGLGILRGAPAVGALLMSAAMTRWPLRRRVGRSLLIAVAVYGLCMVVFGLSSSFALSLLALAISGGADTVSVVVRQTLVQIETPDAMRGRVSAVNSVFIGASNQLGEFESGASAAWLGPVASVVLGGIGTLLVAAWWVRAFPALARRDRLDRP